MEKITFPAILQALHASAETKTPANYQIFADRFTEKEDSPLWIDAVSTNSRELADLAAAGHHTLFVPLVGERVDAHRFIPDAREVGATAALASRSWLQSAKGQELLSLEGVRLLSPCAKKTPLLHCDTEYQKPASNPEQSYYGKPYFTCIEVEDTLDALQSLAAWYRSLFSIPVIGITGSVGKTTTKEMVAAALETALTIHKTAGNQNSQVGLPLTLFGLERRHQAAVIEMGMSEFGEMSRLAAMARPDHAIMTNIGVAHIGNLGSQENIRSEKLHITDFFQEKSMLFLNADDPLLADCQTLFYEKTPFFSFPQKMSENSLIFFGAEGSIETSKTTPAFYATQIQASGTGQTFLFHYPDGEPAFIELQVLGLHNVRNALAALTVAWKLGIPPKTAKQGLASYAPLAMRGNLIEANGIRILDDSYNASPDSMKSSIEVLSSVSTKNLSRRFVALADVLELGEQSEALHREVGTFLALHNRRIGQADQAPINCLITIGTESLLIEKGFLEEVRPADPPLSCHHFEENAEAAAFLKAELRPGDAVLIKGSRGMKTEEIVAALQHG